MIEERSTLLIITPRPVELIRAVHQYCNFLVTRSFRNVSTELLSRLIPMGVPSNLLILASSIHEMFNWLVHSGQKASVLEL